MPNPNLSSNLRIAIIYDHLNTRYGGAEHILTALQQLYPKAVFFTSLYDPNSTPWTTDWQIWPSFLQSWPIPKTWHRPLVPFMPLAFENHDLGEFDIVISVTSAEAKGVLTKPHQLHLCYLLTPTRYLYSHSTEYIKLGLKSSWLRLVAQPIAAYLRWWDQAAASRPDQYLAISRLVAQRCSQYYHRTPAKIMYPPINLPALPIQSSIAHWQNHFHLPESYHLVLSRLVTYKRIDVAIAACLKLNQNLVIIGEGPEKATLMKQAAGSPHILFLGHQPPEIAFAILSGARSLLMPALEDFGITAVEAASLGVPVILHEQSGATEILPKNSRITVSETSPAALFSALATLTTSNPIPSPIHASTNALNSTPTFASSSTSTLITTPTSPPPKTSSDQKFVRKFLRQYGTKEFCQRFSRAVDSAWNTFNQERTL